MKREPDLKLLSFAAQLDTMPPLYEMAIVDDALLLSSHGLIDHMKTLIRCRYVKRKHVLYPIGLAPEVEVILKNVTHASAAAEFHKRLSRGDHIRQFTLTYRKGLGKYASRHLLEQVAPEGGQWRKLKQ